MREGWVCEILKKATLFKSGKTVSKNIEKENGEILYTKVGDMNLEGNEEYMTTSTRYVDLQDINANQIIPIGSVIFPKRGGAIATNKKRRIIKPTIVDLNTMAVGPTEKLHPDYLYYWFESIDLEELSNGTSIPQINNNSFDSVYISYPQSLTEQKQIVSILDQAFAAIDQAKANIEKNIENAKELFQSKLNEIFSQPALSGADGKGDGWEEKNLTEIALDLLQGINTTTDKIEFTASGIPILQAKEIGDNCLEMEKVKYVSEDTYATRKERYKPQKGDILLNNIGSSLGRTIVVDWDFDFTIAWNVMRVIPNTRIIRPEFLRFAFMSPIFQNMIWSNTRGVGMPFVSKKQLLQFDVSIPSDLSIQDSYIEELSQLQNFEHIINQKYEEKIISLEELKKSILQKAFAGELSGKKVLL